MSEGTGRAVVVVFEISIRYGNLCSTDGLPDRISFAWIGLTSDVGEKVCLMNLPGSFRKFQQGLICWTADSLRIGEVLVNDPFKCVEQFLFRIHSARPGCNWTPTSNPLLVLAKNPTTRDHCR